MSLFVFPRVERRVARPAGAVFESLEPRLQWDAAPVAAFDPAALPAVAVPGQKLAVRVNIEGATGLSKRLSVVWAASIDSAAGGADDVSLSSGAAKPSGRGDARVVAHKLVLPPALTPGDYHLVATLTDPATGAAFSAVSAATVRVVWQAGQTDAGPVRSVRFDAGGGAPVTLAAGGGARATVTPDGVGGLRLDVVGAGPKGSVKVSGGGAAFGVVAVDGPLASLRLPADSVAGRIVGNAGIGSIAAGALTTGLVVPAVSKLSIAGGLSGAVVVIGASLGSDGAPGGTGPAADAFADATVSSLTVGGAVERSVIAVGASAWPVDDPAAAPAFAGTAGTIAKLTIGGLLDDASRVLSPVPPRSAKIGGRKVSAALDPRFIWSGGGGTWAGAGAGAGWAVGGAIVTGPTVAAFSLGSGDRGAVYKGDQLLPFVRAAATRRVDVAGIGDSNQLFFGGVGHDGGQEAAWAAAVGLYGSGVMPFNAVDNFGTIGNWASPGVPFGAAVPPAPAEFAGAVLPRGVGFVDSPAVVLPGSSVTSDASRAAMTLSGTSAWGNAAEQRWHYTYGTFPGGGSFAPSARVPGTADIVATKSVNAAGAAGGLVDDYLSIPAGTGDVWLEPTRFLDPAGGVTGGFYADWQRVESVGRTAGVAYSTLLAQGGQSTRNAAQALRAAPDAALDEWARQATRLQNVPAGEQRLMVQILQGANDHADPAPAVGSDAPTDTPAGYAANLRVVIDELRDAWADGGRDPAKLNFVIGAYHGRPDEQVADYAAFEEAAMGVADATAGVTVIRGTRLFSFRTTVDNGWYVGGAGSTDYPHLSNDGFYGVGRLTVNQMTSLARDGAGRSAVSSVRVDLSADVPALATADATIADLSTGRPVAAQDMTLFYDPATHRAEWTFPGLDGDVLPAGQYRLTVDAPGMSAPFVTTFAAAGA